MSTEEGILIILYLIDDSESEFDEAVDVTLEIRDDFLGL